MSFAVLIGGVEDRPGLSCEWFGDDLSLGFSWVVYVFVFGVESSIEWYLLPSYRAPWREVIFFENTKQGCADRILCRPTVSAIWVDLVLERDDFDNIVIPSQHCWQIVHFVDGFEEMLRRYYNIRRSAYIDFRSILLFLLMVRW